MTVVYDWERLFKEEVSLHLSVRCTSLLSASCLLSYQPLLAVCDSLLWGSLELSQVVLYSRDQAHDWHDTKLLCLVFWTEEAPSNWNSYALELLCYDTDSWSNAALYGPSPCQRHNKPEVGGWEPADRDQCGSGAFFHVWSTKVGQSYLKQSKKELVPSLFWDSSAKLLSPAQIKHPLQCRSLLQQQQKLNYFFAGYSGLLQMKVETLAPLNSVLYWSQYKKQRHTLLCKHHSCYCHLCCRRLIPKYLKLLEPGWKVAQRWGKMRS